ncbi:MAG: hypothetical protein P1V81_05285 [Planctomycetota bacterium]|nr:hypothetical protein [Planctomycetota bacterium]
MLSMFDPVRTTAATLGATLLLAGLAGAQTVTQHYELHDVILDAGPWNGSAELFGSFTWT